VAAIASDGSTSVVVSVAHLVTVLGRPILRDDATVVCHQEASEDVEGRVGTGELVKLVQLVRSDLHRTADSPLGAMRNPPSQRVSERKSRVGRCETHEFGANSCKRCYSDMSNCVTVLTNVPNCPLAQTAPAGVACIMQSMTNAAMGANLATSILR
jgi:hypothetical protein